MRSIPSATQPLVNPQTGLVTPEWFKHLSGDLSDAGKVLAQTMTASPFAYTANVPGHLLVKGGTVSAIAFNRARVTITTGLTSGFVPMSAGDVVTITYSSAPTVSFIPE